MSEKDPRKGKEMQLVSLPPSDHPETLASPNSVAAEEGTSEGRTFSQLLAGAIVSPVGSPRGEDPVAPLSPSFLASPTLLDTQQGFTGQFTMTHQAVLATVTAQAHMHLQTPEASTNSSQQLVLTPTSGASLHQTPGGNSSTPEAEKPPLKSELKTQSAQTVVKTNPNDGYNWRKYGQKQVKSSDRSRSYYKCTNVNCSAKKKVERCPDGKETEITYCGQHNHGLPKRHKSLKERGTQSGGPTRPSRENEALNLPSCKVNRSDPSTKREHISRRETPELLTYCSSDGEEDFAKAEEEHGDEPYPKRRLSESIAPYSAPVLRTVKEPKIIVQSSCDMARISDGYRWRKYGQKIVKGNPNPRSYYRCTHDGCPVRKHVERASDDVKAILITYEGKHNHDQPAQKSDGDQPNTALLIAAAVASVNQDEELQSPNSLDGNSGKSIAGNNAKELGGEKAIESAQTLLSMGFNSSSGETANGTNSDGIKRRPLFNKNHSIVPVQNS